MHFIIIIIITFGFELLAFVLFPNVCKAESYLLVCVSLFPSQHTFDTNFIVSPYTPTCLSSSSMISGTSTMRNLISENV